AATEALVRFPFPGNVRQLENICHWLTVMAPSPLVDVRDLPPELREAGGGAGALEQHVAAGGANVGVRRDSTTSETVQLSGAPAAHHQAPGWINGLELDALARLRAGEINIMQDMTRDFERTLILAALQATAGRRVDAASRLGLGRNT